MDVFLIAVAHERWHVVVAVAHDSMTKLWQVDDCIVHVVMWQVDDCIVDVVLYDCEQPQASRAGPAVDVQRMPQCSATGLPNCSKVRNQSMCHSAPRGKEGSSPTSW